MPSRAYEAYLEGQQAFKEGRHMSENPYIPDHHERETTYNDEKNRYWDRGWEDAQANECDPPSPED